MKAPIIYSKINISLVNQILTIVNRSTVDEASDSLSAESLEQSGSATILF
jgi:hypothetical protein